MLGKQLCGFAVLMAMSSTVALAQTSPPAAQPAPAAAAPAVGDPATPAEAKAPALAPAPGDLAATKIVGATVYNSVNEAVGEINDVVISQNGTVTAVLIGVGGFLGVGEKVIALPYAALKIARGDNNALKISIDGSNESLKALPDYKAVNS
jgi:sporulation protein YlmC with PRC-barrel domain